MAASAKEPRASFIFRFLPFTFALVLVLFGYFLGPHPAFLFRSSALSSQIQPVSYQVQVFQTDPVMLHIRDFLNKDEISHIIESSRGNFEVSRVWPDEVGYVDINVRVSETAPIMRDDIIRNIEERAKSFIGWRNNSTGIQPMKVQKYGFNGYYTFHYDWDGGSKEGNRMTTFMVYLNDNFTGGGTNFPRIKHPNDPRWCDVIVCEGDEDDEGYDGVTFKPISGAAVYWENFHPNGTPHEGTRHAGLPVKSGEKFGLNLWSWDKSWRPSGEISRAD